MKSWELLKVNFRQAGCKQVAQSLHVSLSLVHRWSAPCACGSGFINPLDRIAQLLRLTGDRRLAQWVCHEANGYFVPNPPVKPTAPAELLPATGAVMEELGRLQAGVGAALKKKSISPAEAETLRQMWEDLKADMEQYVTRCEAGVFRRLPVQLFWLIGWWFTTGEVVEG